MNEDVRLYELSFWLSPETIDVDTQAFVDEMVTRITSADGSISHKGRVEQRRLSHPVRHHTTGYFGYFRFTATPEAARGLIESLRHEKKVLRSILVQLTPKEALAHDLGTTPYRKRHAAPLSPESATAGTGVPQPGAPTEDKVKIEELEEKLEEILGKETA